MSPLPPRPEPAPRRSGTDPHGPGWRPADGDRSSKAIEWHALRGSRLGEEARGIALEALAGLRALTAQIAETDARWSKRWATLARIGWPVLIALCVAGSLGAAATIWHFVSTLHHDPPALPAAVAAPR